MKAVLESDGFQTIEAENGVQALELVRKLGTGVALMVADIKMPLMDGLELAGLVHSEFPPIPIILTSGYSADVQNPAFEFFPKPFRVETLLSAVKKVMLRKAAQYGETAPMLDGGLAAPTN